MIFMLALSSTSKWCKEERASPSPSPGYLCWFRTIFLVESCRLVLLDIWTDAGHLLLSHHLLARPLLSLLCLHVAAISPLYFSLSLMSSPHLTPQNPSLILTASQGPAGQQVLPTASITCSQGTSWRHSVCPSAGGGGGVFNNLVISLLSSPLSPILPKLLPNNRDHLMESLPALEAWVHQARPAGPVSSGQNLAFPQLIYEFDFDFDLPTVVMSDSTPGLQTPASFTRPH